MGIKPDTSYMVFCHGVAPSCRTFVVLLLLAIGFLLMVLLVLLAGVEAIEKSDVGRAAGYICM